MTHENTDDGFQSLFQAIDMLTSMTATTATTATSTQHDNKNDTQKVPLKRSKISINDLLLAVDTNLVNDHETASNTSGSMSPVPSLVRDAFDTLHGSSLSVPPKNNLNNLSNQLHVSISHGLVAQKSYGAERRYLSPPPQLTLTCINPQTLTLYIQLITAADTEIMDMKICPSHQQSKHIFVLKQLYVPGVKEKTFYINVKLYSGSLMDSASMILECRSDAMQMISKPSRNSISPRSASSLSIKHSDSVSLFCRINSQTVRTRYISLDGNSFKAHANSTWSSLTIKNIHNRDSNPNSSDIHYGSVIILQDSMSGVESPRLIVRKVDKSALVLDATGVVSQMHKIALQSTLHSTMFWSVSDISSTSILNDLEHVIFRRVESDQSVGDSLCWTIVSVGSVSATTDNN